MVLDGARSNDYFARNIGRAYLVANSEQEAVLRSAFGELFGKYGASVTLSPDYKLLHLLNVLKSAERLLSALCSKFGDEGAIEELRGHYPSAWQCIDSIREVIRNSEGG